MKLTFLGTGSERGVPVYGCQCEACKRALVITDYHRRPSVLLVESGSGQLLINAGLTDLANRFSPGMLQYILLSSLEMQHIQGLLPLRWGENLSIKVIAPQGESACQDLLNRNGILQFANEAKSFAELELQSLRVVPVPLSASQNHIGYVIRNQKSIFAYLSKATDIPLATLEYLSGMQLDLLVLDCTHPPQKNAVQQQNDINAAMELHSRFKPTKTLLTCIGHELDLWAIENEETLPANMELAVDRLSLAV